METDNIHSNMKSPTYKRHDDDEWWDEIRITTVPRYKTSGLSGDEWRTSARIQVFRKGVLMGERYMSKLEYAAASLPGWLLQLGDEGFSGDHKTFERLCFQPGCKEVAEVEYELKDEYYRAEGDKKPKKDWRGPARRRFCGKHALRGDCGLEDADANYILISAPEGWQGKASYGAQAAESPSAQATIAVNSLDDLPEAINQLRKAKS